MSSAKKMSASSCGGEVAVADAPVADGLGYAGDEVADTLLTLGGADLAVEILAEATMLVAVTDQSEGTSTALLLEDEACLCSPG